MSGTNEWEKAKGVLAPYFPDGVKSEDLLNGERGGPGGTNADLRELIADVIRDETEVDYEREDDGSISSVVVGRYEAADAILAEIAASGHVIVTADQWRRVRTDAREYNLLYQLGARVQKPRCQGVDFGMGGDLEPVEGER